MYKTRHTGLCWTSSQNKKNLKCNFVKMLLDRLNFNILTNCFKDDEILT